MQKEKSDKMNLYKKMNRHLLSEKVTSVVQLGKMFGICHSRSA